jgi:hypothetical protein
MMQQALREQPRRGRPLRRRRPGSSLRGLLVLLVPAVLLLVTQHAPSCHAAAWPHWPKPDEVAAWNQWRKPKPDISSAAACRAASGNHVYPGAARRAGACVCVCAGGGGGGENVRVRHHPAALLPWLLQREGGSHPTPNTRLAHRPLPAARGAAPQATASTRRCRRFSR